MPLPADNPSSAAVWTQNEECISWRDSPHGVAETERQHCLITGPTNSTQSWWNTETGQNIGLRFWESLIEGGWVRVCLTAPLPTVENRNNEILFRLKAVQIRLSCHCPPGLFFLGPRRLQIQTHIESFMRPSMGEAHIRSHAGNLMNIFSYLGVSQKPTGQQRGECEKVSDSQAPVPVPVHIFRHGKDRAISSVTTGHNFNYSCMLSVCFTFTKVRPWKDS